MWLPSYSKQNNYYPPHILISVVMVSLPKMFDTVHIILRITMLSSNSELSFDAGMDSVLVSDCCISSPSFVPSLNTLVMVILNFGGGTGVFSSVQFMVAPCGGMVPFPSRQNILPIG